MGLLQVPMTTFTSPFLPQASSFSHFPHNAYLKVYLFKAFSNLVGFLTEKKYINTQQEFLVHLYNIYIYRI